MNNVREMTLMTDAMTDVMTLLKPYGARVMTLMTAKTEKLPHARAYAHEIYYLSVISVISVIEVFKLLILLMFIYDSKKLKNNLSVISVIS